MKRELKRKYLSNKYRQKNFNTFNLKYKESSCNHTQWNYGGTLRNRLKEDSTRSISTSFVPNGNEVSLVPLNLSLILNLLKRRKIFCWWKKNTSS